jgi:hypothetical protein
MSQNLGVVYKIGDAHDWWCLAILARLIAQKLPSVYNNAVGYVSPMS